MTRVAFLFSATIFTSAFLLFFVQPLAGRMLLPVFGGSALVWNASMMFFQAALLGGYVYAHVSIGRLGSWRQSRLHIALMVIAMVFLPLSIQPEAPGQDAMPALFVIQTLLVSIGLPFFVLSASAPMLQRWYVNTTAEDADDPYWLYVASNVGSLLALIAYPVIIEPTLTVSQQKFAWTGGYVLLLLLCIACVFQVQREDPRTSQVEETRASWKQRLMWAGLAFIPSSALLGYTSHITTDISAIPLFWVVPLALYMLSFVIVFGRRRRISSTVYAVLAFIFLIPSAYTVLMAILDPVVLLLPLQLVSLFFISLAFHSLLVDRKPAASSLTDFYVWMSVGGMAGGIFNALLAPNIFNTMYELPMTMGVAAVILALHIPYPKFEWTGSIKTFVKSKGFQISLLAIALCAGSWGFVEYIQTTDSVDAIGHWWLVSAMVSPFALWLIRPVLGGIVTLAACLVVPLGFQHTNLLFQGRSPYAIHEVRRYESAVDVFNSLYHGRIQHGIQGTDPQIAQVPLSYYHTSSPIGEVMAIRDDIDDRSPAGFVGLGVGTLAAYHRTNTEMIFFEIDPAIEKIARNTEYFTYLEMCGDKCKVILGDARLSLAQQPKGYFGLLVLDAYSSDSVPAHLVSAEAIELYISLLKPGGILMFHVSNRFVNVGQIVVNTAHSLGYVSYTQDHWPRETKLDDLMVNASEWVLVAKTKKDAEWHIFDPRWEEGIPDERPPWTDDWSNILKYLAW